MKKITMFLIICLLFTCAISGATYAGENPKACKQCAMDLDAATRGRMLIVYSDGSTSWVCSLDCAVEDIKQNKDKKVKSITVADYATGEMIDAAAAIWVVGGDKKGVMTSKAKWAFAREGDAQKFVKENGGEITPFDQVMKIATQEMAEGSEMQHDHHGHMGHDMSHMGPGSQILYNPAFGDDIYHTHPAGMWMVNYKYMYTNMGGLRDGSNNVDTYSVGWNSNKPYNYMMIPTSMTMDMHMFMVMYGVTDRLTLMGMANYQANEMQMLMNMGMGMRYTTEPPMRTSGFGDSELRAIYSISKKLTGSLGLSIPTGSIKQTVNIMRTEFRAPYDMQLGSGTYDLKPALTYNDLSEDAKWNWGGQAMYTYHISKNAGGYSVGDNLKLTSWVQRAFGPAATWLRLAFNDTGRIKGQDSEIQKILDPVTGAPSPDADPRNYGGQRLDGLIGASIQAGRLSFGVEGGIPLYQNLNGLQLKTKWILNAGIQVMF